MRYQTRNRLIPQLYGIKDSFSTMLFQLCSQQQQFLGVVLSGSVMSQHPAKQIHSLNSNFPDQATSKKLTRLCYIFQLVVTSDIKMHASKHIFSYVPIKVYSCRDEQFFSIDLSLCLHYLGDCLFAFHLLTAEAD